MWQAAAVIGVKATKRQDSLTAPEGVLCVSSGNASATKIPLDNHHESVGVWSQDLDMSGEGRNHHQSLLGKPITALSGLPWLEVGEKAWQIIRKAVQGWSHSGMYRVLRYESTLELKDRDGMRAAFKKGERVRYLQDNIIAYQDQAWGEGKILPNYRCTPGTPVDQYRSGYKTHILISR